MIKLFIVVFLALVTNVSLAENRPWTSEERAWGYAAGAMLLGDWITTRNMTKRYNEGYYEHNPFLGRHPTTAQVNRHFAISVPIVFLIADNWEKERKNFLITITVVEGLFVANNLSIGLRLQY